MGSTSSQSSSSANGETACQNDRNNGKLEDALTEFEAYRVVMAEVERRSVPTVLRRLICDYIQNEFSLGEQALTCALHPSADSLTVWELLYLPVVFRHLISCINGDLTLARRMRRLDLLIGCASETRRRRRRRIKESSYILAPRNSPIARNVAVGYLPQDTTDVQRREEECIFAMITGVVPLKGNVLYARMLLDILRPHVMCQGVLHMPSSPIKITLCP